MKTKKKSDLLTVINSEELRETFFKVLFQEIQSDEEPYYKKSYRLLNLFEMEPEITDEFLITVCGWSMETLLKMTIEKEKCEDEED